MSDECSGCGGSFPLGSHMMGICACSRGYCEDTAKVHDCETQCMVCPSCYAPECARKTNYSGHQNLEVRGAETDEEKCSKCENVFDESEYFPIECVVCEQEVCKECSSYQRDENDEWDWDKPTCFDCLYPDQEAESFSAPIEGYWGQTVDSLIKDLEMFKRNYSGDMPVVVRDGIGWSGVGNYDVSFQEFQTTPDKLGADEHDTDRDEIRESEDKIDALAIVKTHYEPAYVSRFGAESFGAEYCEECSYREHDSCPIIEGCPCCDNTRRAMMDAESFNAEGLLFTPYENTKSGKRITMNISQEDMANFDKLPSQQNEQTITIKNLKNGKKYVVRRADCGAGCYCAAEVVRILKPREKTFNAPYAGAGALMPIKGDTSLSSFSGKELAESSAIHGDFNQASINYSGHQNLEVRGAESKLADLTKQDVADIGYQFLHGGKPKSWTDIWVEDEETGEMVEEGSLVEDVESALIATDWFSTRHDTYDEPFLDWFYNDGFSVVEMVDFKSGDEIVTPKMLQDALDKSWENSNENFGAECNHEDWVIDYSGEDGEGNIQVELDATCSDCDEEGEVIVQFHRSQIDEDNVAFDAESFAVEATEHHEIVLEVESELRGLYKALDIVRRTQREGLHITTAEYEINKEIEFGEEVLAEITEDDFDGGYFGAESFEAHGIGSDEKCDYCELPMDYCERLRGVKHSPREGGIGRYKLDCHQCGEMYESCPECNGDICFDCHNDICIFCGCNTLKYAAESFGAEYGKRQRFGNRYVGRDTKGKFISNVSVGRSLKADRRNKSKTPARSGFGHRGDIQKGGATGFTLPSDTKRMIGMGAVLGGILAYWESKA